MTCIETLLLAVLICIITVIEFRTGRSLGYAPVGYKDTDGFIREGNSEMDKLLRRDALKSIIGTLKGNKDIFTNQDLGDTKSLPDRFRDSDEEEEN